MIGMASAWPASAWAMDVSAADLIFSAILVKRSISVCSVESRARCNSSAARFCCRAARSSMSAPGLPQRPRPI